jgi:hypothetical protein
MTDENTSDKAAQAHEESKEAIQELAEQVEQAESQEGEPTPSQADADETAATGI